MQNTRVNYLFFKKDDEDDDGKNNCESATKLNSEFYYQSNKNKT